MAGQHGRASWWSSSTCRISRCWWWATTAPGTAAPTAFLQAGAAGDGHHQRGRQQLRPPHAGGHGPAEPGTGARGLPHRPAGKCPGHRDTEETVHMAAKATKKSSNGPRLPAGGSRRRQTPQNVYMFYGEETYLRDRYLEELQGPADPGGLRGVQLPPALRQGTDRPGR